MNKCIDCGKDISYGAKRCTECHCSILNKNKVGKPLKESTKRKLSELAMGRIISSEAREKMREAKLKNPVRYWSGKKRSQETKDKVSRANKGNKAWNKGKSWSDEMKQRFSEIHKGNHYSPETEFKNGCIPVNAGIFGNSIHSAHNWIKAQNIETLQCKICGSNSNLEWSNKDHKYRKNLNDWQYVCRKCHMKYDREKNGCRL